MEKTKNVIGLKALSSLLMAFVLIVASCSKSEDSILSATDTQNVNSESASDSFTDEVSDFSNISVGGLTDLQYAGGRSEGGDIITTLKDLDDRLKCATVTLTRTGTKIAPAGNILIDFGTGCTDSKGVVRKGKITVTYAGIKFAFNSTITTTFDGFFRDGIKVEGTHTLKNVQGEISKLLTNPKFTAIITGGKITFADGKTITREQTITREWQRALNSAQDKWVISKGGEAHGSNKNGKSYYMSITTDLVYSRACAINNKVFIPVSGTKTIEADDKKYIVDFGAGDCDNDVTVTVNGVSKKITVTSDGN